MHQDSETWTPAHDLALLFAAVGYGSNKKLTDDEIASINGAVAAWRPGASIEEIREIVMEAMAVILEGDADEEVARSIRSLKEALSLEQRLRALDEAMTIAEADGLLHDTEHSLITVLAEIWEIEPTTERLRELSPAGEHPLWSLLHDIALMYIVLAHGSDSRLTEAEIGAMTMRLEVWQPDLGEDEIRDVLRQALQFYATGPSRDDLDDSSNAILETLSRTQRMEILNDLAFIAEADGPITRHETEMIELLAGVWKVRPGRGRGEAFPRGENGRK